MTSAKVLKELIAICDANPLNMDAEIVARMPDGTILRINAVIWQSEAEEVQLFVAPA